MAGTKPPRARALPVKVHSLTLTSETVAQLERLAADLGDVSGRAVSLSGAVRVLAAFASQEGYELTVNRLLPIVEAQQRRTVWGSLPAKKPPRRN
jgi:hypothetical protein